MVDGLLLALGLFHRRYQLLVSLLWREAVVEGLDERRLHEGVFVLLVALQKLDVLTVSIECGILPERLSRFRKHVEGKGRPQGCRLGRARQYQLLADDSGLVVEVHPLARVILEVVHLNGRTQISDGMHQGSRLSYEVFAGRRVEVQYASVKPRFLSVPIDLRKLTDQIGSLSC